MNNILEEIEGLEKLDPALLEDFKQEMTEKVIPEVITIMQERAILAEEARKRRMK